VGADVGAAEGAGVGVAVGVVVSTAATRRLGGGALGGLGLLAAMFGGEPPGATGVIAHTMSAHSDGPMPIMPY